MKLFTHLLVHPQKIAKSIYMCNWGDTVSPIQNTVGIINHILIIFLNI